jgi:hypothetical protein
LVAYFIGGGNRTVSYDNDFELNIFVDDLDSAVVTTEDDVTGLDGISVKWSCVESTTLSPCLTKQDNLPIVLK